MKCQAEMEPVLAVKAPEQAAEWEEAEAPVAAGAVVMQRALAVIAFARTVGKRYPINWDLPAMSIIVPIAEQP